MFRRLQYSIILVFVLCGCCKTPGSIPTGKWNYKLLVNDVHAGSAIISNEIVHGNYVSSSKFEISLGKMTSILEETITETKDFVPIKLESYNKLVNGDNENETLIIANFNGRQVEILSDNNKAVHTIERDFILDGNYFMAKLIEGKFKKDLKITNHVYHPSVELEKPVMVETVVVGWEEIEIENESIRLIHLEQSMENVKNIDLYIDRSGILWKLIIRMLNIKIEFIKV